MMKRPLYLTILSWILLVIAVLRIILPIQIFLHPPKAVNPHFNQIMHVLLIDFISSALIIIASIAMLRAKNWGRWLLLIMDVAFWVFVVLYYGIHGNYILPFIVTTAIMLLLFLPHANQYFQQSSSVSVKESDS